VPKNRKGRLHSLRGLKYESKEIVAEKDFVIVHERLLGLGQSTDRVSAGIFPVKDDVRERGHAGTVKERPAHVRRCVHEVNHTRNERYVTGSVKSMVNRDCSADEPNLTWEGPDVQRERQRN
jgi:hypothetical protein